MKVLLVSIAFPPKQDPESLQVAKYCKYLNLENDIQLETVTSSDPTLFMDTDPSLKFYREGLNVSREIKIFENRYLNLFFRKINPEFLMRPDSKFTFWWQHNTVSRSVQIPDILYSRSYPVSSTLLALELKRKWKIPWILHLSDPWAVASTNSLSPATHLIGKARQWNKRKEIACFELADKICLTSHKTIELYTQEYPMFTDKFTYMPNVFDDDLVVDNVYTRGKYLTFLYTGGFGEARSPLTLLNAISIFYKKHLLRLGNNIRFLFTGEMTRKNQAIFEAHSSIPIIRHLGVIPYSEVISLQRQADILINIDSNISDPRHAVFFPSKLLDYMAAQRTIMAITNRYSTTYEVVEGKLGKCFDFNESELIADYICDLLEKFNQNDTSAFYRPEFQKEFSAKLNARRLANLFFDLKIIG